MMFLPQQKHMFGSLEFRLVIRSFGDPFLLCELTGHIVPSIAHLKIGIWWRCRSCSQT